MKRKRHDHRVTLSQRRLHNKKRSDMIKKSVSPSEVKQTFNLYFRDQVRELYKAIMNSR